MRINWHIPLPGPFSISGPVVPRVKPRRRRPSARQRAAGGPRQAPQSMGAGFGIILLGLLLVIFLVLAVNGFRLY